MRGCVPKMWGGTANPEPHSINSIVERLGDERRKGKEEERKGE